MADKDPIPAPHRIVEDDKVIYGTGEPVPYDEAVRLGLTKAARPTKKAAAKRGRRKQTPAEDRARKGPAEDR